MLFFFFFKKNTLLWSVIGDFTLEDSCAHHYTINPYFFCGVGGELTKGKEARSVAQG